MIATNKLIDRKGMTLTELLAGIIVMLLVAGIMVIGVKLGSDAYVKSVSMSEAQQLCSTLTSLVNDELRYCSEVYVKDSKVGIFSENFGKGTNDTGLIYAQDDKGQVVLEDEVGNLSYKILSSRSYPYNLKATVDLTYDKTNTAFENGVFNATIKVYRTEGKVLATTTFQVQPLNYVVEKTQNTTTP